jgi:REP element-mobilizing transposase RayT
MPCPQVAGLTEKELQNNQQIIIILTMSKIVGYMVTWRTYGSWLPGDERGYVTDGQILPGDLKTLERGKKRLKSPAVKLNKKEIQLVRNTILNEAERIGQKIIALTVCTNHIHLTARPHPKSIEDIIGRYKSITTRALWEIGRKGRIWTKGYDKRFCFSEEELTRKIQYVNKHNLD